MATYIISYDLRGQRQYDALYAAIKKYPAWAHITESTWAVKTGRSAVAVRDNLTKSIDADDRIFVVKSGVEAAWRNVKCKSEWLKEHL